MRTVLFLLVAALLPLAGCGDGENGIGPDPDISGTYTLQSANGANLPVHIPASDVYEELVPLLGVEAVSSFQLTSGSLALRDDRTFTLQLTARFTGSGAVSPDTRTRNGTYDRTGNALQLYIAEQRAASGIVSGSTITLSAAEIAFVFSK